MCTTVRELWLTGWKGKKGGLHERVREREREREREVRRGVWATTIVTKDRRWLWGLQYFCYGTLNSYEFSNATTAVNNGESARNNGGRNTFSSSPWLFFFVFPPIEIRRFFLVTDRSIDFCFSSRGNLAAGKKEIKSLVQCFKENCEYSMVNSRNFDF